MIEYPGCSYYPIVYADEEVVIRKAWEVVHVYHRCSYKTPFGKAKSEWLQNSIWKISTNGKYCEQNGIGYLTGRTAETVEDIAKAVKQC